MQEYIMFSLIGFGVTSLLCFTLYPFVIPKLHKLKFGQTIHELGPKSHQAKQGTPTIGGIVFVLVGLCVMSVIQFTEYNDSSLSAIIIVYLGMMIIGLIDDLLIVVKKNNAGLSAYSKVFLQIFVVLLAVFFYPDLIKLESYTTLIFMGISVNLGYLYMAFILFMIVAYSNAVNLTDGLDGLSSMSVIIALIFMSFIAIFEHKPMVLISNMIVIGSLLSFYIFNKKPAKIFMGDTGSLALGGYYAIVAVLLKVEMLSIIIGFLFVLETLSVIAQVGYYKMTKKRIFRMAPLHHHFEMGRLKESGTVYFFYVLSMIFGLIGMVIYFV